MSSYIEVESLCFSRGYRSIFDGLTLSIPRGKVTAIMGPSGIGKTTLLKLIGGQLRPDAGRVLVDGQDFQRLSREQLFEERSKMGMLFQSGALFSDISVYENVAFPLRAHTKLPEDMIRDVVIMKLNAVGLRGARDMMPSELSGGMTRRVALARAALWKRLCRQQRRSNDKSRRCRKRHAANDEKNEIEPCHHRPHHCCWIGLYCCKTFLLRDGALEYFWTGNETGSS